MSAVQEGAHPRIAEIAFNESALAQFVSHIQANPDDPDNLARFLLEYPTVYIVHHHDGGTACDAQEFSIYVGETNDINRRTIQHLRQDPRTRHDWRQIVAHPDATMHIIGHELFNKSLTLDIEDRLMTHLLGSRHVRHLYNRRPNPQRNYHTKEQIDEIFKSIWSSLHARDEQLFPPDAEVRNSALYKASPFHNLTIEQLDAKGLILEAVQTAVAADQRGQLILVSGQAGSGKTVLLSSLFLDIMEIDRGVEELTTQQPRNYLLVNHKEQLTVYQEIAKKLQLYSAGKYGTVMSPTRFINNFTTEQPADVVLVDEAHLLWTQGTQGYSGADQLQDLLKRARVVVAVMDHNQILRNKQYRNIGEFEQLQQLATEHIELHNQLRINGSKETLSWLRTLIDQGTIGHIPDDENYDLRIFDDPSKMHEEIRRRATVSSEFDGLSRMVASYDWPYKPQPNSEGLGLWNVEIDGKFSAPWNYQLKSTNKNWSSKHQAWAEQEHTIEEIGSTFTIQGFDLNYVGVILGPSVGYEDGRLVFRPEKSHNRDVRSRRTLRDGTKAHVGEQMLRNEINVLLTRGIRGLYIYAVDQNLRDALMAAAKGTLQNVK
ncbi:DUF2075 domain-containing protein [Schaalia vaccimaxillae]|uniref:DUF2075 domain-containing protein n=1 Tax=Schaalia vaccimaxillae TaxID=183916 RepID=UPI0003B7BAC1|nr:DUF2075 domain-containing protein [Schaalia vaccimaxillae]